MKTAKATYRVTSWDEEPVYELEGGAKLTRASVKATYEGDIEGESRSESLMWYRTDGTAAYITMERIEGRIGEQRGSFVLRSVGSYDGTNARARQEVVADSGTGDLGDLRGEGTFEAPPGHEGKLELSYALG